MGVGEFWLHASVLCGYLFLCSGITPSGTRRPYRMLRMTQVSYLKGKLLTHYTINLKIFNFDSFLHSSFFCLGNTSEGSRGLFLLLHHRNYLGLH